MANFWMHNGFLQVEGEKMSKSLGNFVTIRELLATETFGGRAWPGEVLRFAMLRTHYRQPIDWTVRALEEAEATLDRWYDAVGDVEPGPDVSRAVLEALSDDLNTPAAIAELHQLAHPAIAGVATAGSTEAGQMEAPELLKTQREPAGPPSARRAPRRQAVGSAGRSHRRCRDRSESLAARTAARAAKNWAESDRLRDELGRLGVAIKDGKGGTTWELKR